MGAIKEQAINQANAERQPDYFISRVTSMEYVLKNNLERRIREEVNHMDRWIIKSGDVEKFKKMFQERIDQANKDHSRCNPVILDIWLPKDNFEEGIARHDIQFYLSMNLQLYLFAMKGFPDKDREGRLICIF
jgi:hypothetical protein